MSNLKDLESQINSELGAGTLLSLAPLSTKAKSYKVDDFLSSGSLALNYALSGNPFAGYAFGRIVEVYGPEQGGKTTLALHAVAEAQKRNLPCLYIDAEHALDIKYARAIGVTEISLNQPDYGEQALEVAERAVILGYKVIVIDSVPALVPRSELEGEMGAAHMGKQARMMGQAMRKLTGRVSKSRTLIIFINQIRMKLGQMFGNPEESPGGKALKFFSSYRLEVRSPRGGAKKEKSLETDETLETGIDTKIKVVKNKLYPPYRTAKVHIVYGIGIDKYKDVVDFLIRKGIGTSKKIIVNNKSYTAKRLQSALQKSSDCRKAVMKLIKDSCGEEEDEL